MWRPASLGKRRRDGVDDHPRKGSARLLLATLTEPAGSRRQVKKPLPLRRVILSCVSPPWPGLVPSRIGQEATAGMRAPFPRNTLPARLGASTASLSFFLVELSSLLAWPFSLQGLCGKRFSSLPALARKVKVLFDRETPHQRHVVLLVALSLLGRSQPKPSRKVFRFFPGYSHLESLQTKVPFCPGLSHEASAESSFLTVRPCCGGSSQFCFSVWALPMSSLRGKFHLSTLLSWVGAHQPRARGKSFSEFVSR